MTAEIAQHLTRALHLIALTLAPRTFSPEPLAGPNLMWRAALALFVFGVAVFGAVKLSSLMGTLEARIAAAFVGAAVLSSLGATWIYQGDGAPLARGVPFVAVPVWGALAITAAALAGYFLGSSWKNKRMGAAVVVLGLGALQLTKAAPYLGSPDEMWREALRHDPAHEVAFEKVRAPLFRDRKYDEVRTLADLCLAVNRACCTCLEARAEVALQKRALQDARSRAAHAALACPDSALSKAIHAEAMVLLGDPRQGHSEADGALALGRHEARLRAVMALALYRLDAYPDAAREVHRAIEAGAGRDAKLLAGRLALKRRDPGDAERWLRPLAEADPGDVDVIYELAVLAEERGQLDTARRGYLDALRLDENRAEARYRMVLLAVKRGDRGEARRYAREFIHAWPSDRRATELADAVGIERPQLPEPKPLAP